MEKILGIDTGTNSLGWCIVQKDEAGNYTLLEHGVNIFQEGVKIEKGIESSRAAERTEHRSIRVHYWRRKVRKIRLITVLSQANLCPPVSFGMLREWRTKRPPKRSDKNASRQQHECYSRCQLSPSCTGHWRTR
jgi:CRISPR-associated endonuclease Csn1